MNIAWLIDSTEIAGSTRAVLALADALVARGHHASIITTGAPLTWRSSSADWEYVDDFAQFDPDAHDLTIVTSPAMLATARAAVPRFAWYCFESEAPRTDAPVPLLAASAALASAYPEAITIGAIVDDDLYRKATPREHEPLRVLLCGPAHEERRGVDDGYRAITHARWFHQRLELVRASPFVPSREEPLDSVQEFHVGLSTAEMTRLMHSCDIVLAANHRHSAVSMVVMEALAAGVPAIVTSIPQFLSFDPQHDYALFAPDDNPVELGERLIEALESPDIRLRLSGRGRQVAEQFRAETVVSRFEKFLEQTRP